MNCTIDQSLWAYLLDEDQKHWPNYIADTEMAINYIINASIEKAPFEFLYGENILLPVNWLFSKNSSLNLQA